MRRSLFHLRGQDKDEISLVQPQLDSAPARWASSRMFSVYFSNKTISSQIGSRNGQYLSSLNILFFLKKKFGRHMSFYGVTDTPDLDFWWCLLWVSKPDWAALFTLGRGIHDACSLRFISGVIPADLLMASMVASRCSSHVCFSRGRMADLNRRPLA